MRAVLTHFRRLLVFGVVGLDGVHPSVLRRNSLGPLRRAGLGRQSGGPRLLHRQHSPPLLGQLRSRLGVGVVHGEVGDYNGYGQSYSEHACQGAESADKHPHVRLGHHVTVADGGHRHQGPPQAEGDAVEVVVRVRLNPLRVINQRSEYHDSENEEENQQRQLLSRGPESLYENFEAGRMPRQFEQPHYPDDRKKFQDVGVFEVFGEFGQDEIYIKAEGGDVVYDVDGRFDEVALVRARDEADEEFECEPSVAEALDVEEGDMSIGHVFVQSPGPGAVRSVDRDVSNDGDPHVGMCLEAE